MVFVRKFLPFLLFLALSLRADENALPRFLQLYYSGDYPKAHELISQIFSNSWKQQVWDERIHAQAEITGCPLHENFNAAAHGMALLHLGDFASAPDCFGQDWLSEFGRAMLADWQSRGADSREAIRKAMILSPDNPDLIYFAADVAPTREMTLDLFNRYLQFENPDPYQKAVAQYSIEFINKTWNIPLNVPVEINGMEKVNSDYRNNELVIHGLINGTEKVSLLLDTGAGGMTLKEKDWRPQLTSDMMMIGIGKKQTSRSTRLVLNTFQAGKYELKNPVAGMVAGMPLNGVDGIVGTALFSGNYMLLPLKSGIDFTLFTCENSDNPVSCLESNGLHFSEKRTMPFYLINRLIILKGRIRDSEDNLDMMLDTGAAHCILSAAAAKRYAHVNYQLSNSVNSSLTGVGGKTNQVLLAENVEVDVGGIKKGFNQMTAMNLGESSEAMELELDMILGRDFLQGFVLLIDYHNKQVTFLK